MPTIEDVAKQPLEQRLARMARTAAELGDAIDGRSEAVLVRRPDLRNWAAKEITLLGPPRDDRGDGRAGVRGGGEGARVLLSRLLNGSGAAFIQRDAA